MNNNYINNNISFGTGVTSLVKQEIRSANPTEIQQAIKRHFSTECDFENNKTIAVATFYALKLLREASEKFHLPFNITPPKIKVFKPTELVKQDSVNFGFCIGTPEKVIKKQPEFDARSIFIKNIPDNIKSWDKQVEEWYNTHFISSDNFLAPFLHEIFHNIHFGIIFKNSYPHGLSNVLSLNKDSFGFNQNRIISEKVSRYAKTSKMELFSECLTKMMTESIENNPIKLTSNPLDKLNQFPKFVREFIEDQLYLNK